MIFSQIFPKFVVIFLPTSIFTTMSGQSTQTKPMKKADIHDFCTAQDLTQITDKPIRIPDSTGHRVILLKLSFSLKSCPENDPLCHWAHLTIRSSLLKFLSNRKYTLVSRFIGRSFDPPKLTATTSDFTLQQLPFQLSLK